MKKVLYFVSLAFLVLFALGCENKTTEVTTTSGEPTKADRKITINYYDGDTFLKSEEYINEITLYNYGKEGYRLIQWYLDKTFYSPYKESQIDQYFYLGTINLYAEMENIMTDFHIESIGKVNDKSFLNPAFKWTNIRDDSSFDVKVFKEDELIDSGTTTSSTYHVRKMLDLNATYKLVVKGKESEVENEFEFTTLPTYSNTVTSITLHDPYQNGMVIQRGVKNKIVGTGPVNQIISVTIDSKSYYAPSDSYGNFEVEIPEREGSFEPITINVSNGVNVSKDLTDVLFGDIYLFTGQSNMQWTTQAADYTDDDLFKLLDSTIRFFSQDINTSTTKLEKTKNGKWFAPTKYNVMNFSAIATITGALLGDELMDEVPLGIITAYQGDTNIANWMGSEYYTGSVSTKYLHYNAMVYPLRYTNLKGVVWYQGCNNSAAGCEYKDYLLKYFENYRDLFNNEDLAFYVIGLACYDGDSGNNFDFSYVRESQALACKEDENAYFISTCDDGDPTYIHPKAKHYICERVAKSILATFYHKQYYKEGPSYKSHTVDGNKVTIELNNASGLTSKGKIKGLYLAGADGKYYEANAAVKNQTIVASCDKVSNPVYIKYGFGKSPFVNVFNKDNFSLVPFRTDELNTDIDLFDYDTTANYTFHPDGSTMELSITSDNNLLIKKTADGKTYGSIRLNKWGAVAYLPEGFKLTLIGHNSGASISMRFIEGDSNEIMAYKVVDNFEGLKTFNIGIGDFTAVYNKKNGVLDSQKIGYIELMIEKTGEATVELVEAKFVHIERTKPMSFQITSVSEIEDNINVSVSKSLFANSYTLSVTDALNNEVYTKTQTDSVFIFPKSTLALDNAYYINVKAVNELGEENASNSGYVFYLKDNSKVTICNFDFKNQEALGAYMQSSMRVHSDITCTLKNGKGEVTTSSNSWQYFIFVLESGAGNGMTKLEFYADFRGYHGQVYMQLSDTSYNNYQYIIDLTEKNEGVFTINLNEFKKGDQAFTTQTLMWVMFNFKDPAEGDTVILDNICLKK